MILKLHEATTFLRVSALYIVYKMGDTDLQSNEVEKYLGVYYYVDEELKFHWHI